MSRLNVACEHAANNKGGDAKTLCRLVAARLDVPPEEADDCMSGSVGCPDCPWHSGWSAKYLRLHGIPASPTFHTPGATR